MKNAVYYILLCVVSTMFFIYTIWKKKDSRLFTLYFFIAGFTYFLEYLTLVWFKGYVYYPNILKIRFYDNVLGAIASNAFVIPMIAVFIAGFNLNFKKILIIAAVITFVEIAFVKLRLYEHIWWSYYFSFFGAVILYQYSKKLLLLFHERLNRITRFIVLFFANLALQASAVFVIAGILNLYIYNIHWFDDPYRGHIAFATIYIMLITTVFVSLIVFHLRWFWVCIGILLPYISDIVLLKMNILIMSDKWSLLNSVIFRILIFACIFMFNKYLLIESETSKSTR